MDCRLTVAQTNPALGNVGRNLEEHVAQIEAARRGGSQVIVFPELSLTGYFLKDQTAEVALSIESREFARLAELSRDISIAVGFVERSDDGRIYNSVAFLEDGAVAHVHRKVHLVTYGMFDEMREFAAGDCFATFRSRHGRFGLLVCEDAWHVSSGYQHFLAGADALIITSCSPGRGVDGGARELASERTWRTLLEAYGLLFQTWVVYSNRVGWEDGVFFWGGSRVIDPFGAQCARLAGLEPGRLDVRLTSDALRRARVATPLRRDSRPDLLARALDRQCDGRNA
ncbi:MAG: carbon-nitrogen hydrolase [Planctomycetes bacterium]|nr:carbon-nitrogen hydrolase [Planctomycetota bacterium]